jgi:hypothetical protein
MDIWVETTEDNLRYLHKAFINLGYQEKSCNEAIVHLQKDHLIKDSNYAIRQSPDSGRHISLLPRIPLHSMRGYKDVIPQSGIPAGLNL